LPERPPRGGLLVEPPAFPLRKTELMLTYFR
jgi:hypothetical protein